MKPNEIQATDKSRSAEWAKSLRAALADMKAGHSRRFKSEKDFFAHLDRLSSKSK